MKTQLVTLRMVREKTVQYQKPMNDPRLVYDVLRPIMEGLPYESFFVLGVDAKNKINIIQEVSRGSAEFCAFLPMDAMKAILVSNSSAAIFAHNHPSGDSKPSEQDKELTESLKGACRVLGVRFLDHVIVGSDNFYTFASNERKEA